MLILHARKDQPVYTGTVLDAIPGLLIVIEKVISSAEENDSEMMYVCDYTLRINIKEIENDKRITATEG